MATQPDQTVITITLPEDGDLPRTGSIITQRKDLATVRAFQYSDIDGIVAAMISSAESLVDVERNPPPMEIKAAPGNAEVLSKKGKAKDKPAEPADAEPATDAPEAEAAQGRVAEGSDAPPETTFKPKQESFIPDDAA